MGMYRSLSGAVRLKLTSADISGAVTGINVQGIPIENVTFLDELSVTFTVERKYVKRLKKFHQKRGERLNQTEGYGMFWSGVRFIHRPVVIFGILFVLLCGFYLPGRILFISVEGNEKLSDHRILEAAQSSGITFGASRRAVRSERVKNAMLADLPELQWAGVNTYGCRAVITVRERPLTPVEPNTAKAGSIVAARDGIVSSVTATKGSAVCRPGQAVKEGQVLISGYSDFGQVVTVTAAEGDVMGVTSRELKVYSPINCLQRGPQYRLSRKFSVRIGKKRINFFKGSGISSASCVKMYSEYVLKLPGGFELPVVLIEERISECVLDAAPVQLDAEKHLSEFAQKYLKQQMIAGVIHNAVEQIDASDGTLQLVGKYICTEMIGRHQDEMIGEYNGKDNRADRERGSGG